MTDLPFRSSAPAPKNNAVTTDPGRHTKMSRTRKLLVGLIVGGAIVTGLYGAGTFASFSASTSNSGSFATGSLVLSNDVDAAGACLSTNGGTTDTNTNACDEVFALTVQKPGDTDTAEIDLINEGSLDGSALRAFATSACAAADTVAEDHHGGGNPCTVISVYVQEYSDAGRTTESACLYGGGVGNVCAFDEAETLATFSASYPNAGTSLGLGAMPAANARYFTIGIEMDADAGNTMQGRTASFGLTWSLVQ